jgi:hypothetical protein
MCVVPTLITKDAQTQKHAAETNAEEAALQRGIAEKNSAAALRTARESKTRELAAFSTESLIDDLEKTILRGMQAVKATLRFGQPPVAAAGKALHQATLFFSGTYDRSRPLERC